MNKNKIIQKMKKRSNKDKKFYSEPEGNEYRSVKDIRMRFGLRPGPEVADPSTLSPDQINCLLSKFLSSASLWLQSYFQPFLKFIALPFDSIFFLYPNCGLLWSRE